MSAHDDAIAAAEKAAGRAMFDGGGPKTIVAAYLSALRAEGYAVVPVEIPEAVMVEMWTGFHNHADKALTMQRVWSAGIAAAQEPTP
jgi:hypothetical protein